MAERLAASLLPAASPSPAPSPSARRAAAAASFPSSCSARAGLRLRSRPSLFSQKAAGHGRGGGALRVVRCMAASDAAQLKSAREDIKELLKTTYCHPILVRLGWHDSGTYDKNIEEWPQRGGADGSLRFDAELKHGANAGLINALKLIQPIKDKYPGITYADLFQLASATAIEEAGGPKIPMKYGRVDVTTPEQCPPEGRLPDAGPRDPAEHLREVFYRMGLDDKGIVALSGAHTLGRSRPDRSGWGKPETKYTKGGPGEPGGQSWTVEWLKFDNSYFKDIKEQRDQDLLVLPTDAALFEDPSFKVYAEKYAEDQEVFFKDYAEAHAKLSDLGAKFDPPEGFSLDDDTSAAPADEKKEEAAPTPEPAAATAPSPPTPAPEPAPAAAPTPEPVAAAVAVATATVDDNNGAAPQPEPFVAAKYSYNKRELSDSMKQKIRSEYEGFGGSPDKALQSNYFLNIMILVAGLAFLSSLVMN
ncbi:probable L-ascorbate peroxidase 8, chloroplastic [Phragmites australis]|uniref:probable L-ascorbate peroxidase 8, chloroplastic n=1 Tax=Phragmites australis TaxID=29695 RepID=UPI002D77EE7E|nr:probable L-ascorbate peroxidase 8, chloroplastic [Phragmites australis]